MKIDYMAVMADVYGFFAANTDLTTALGTGQLIDQTQAQRPPYPIILVCFPYKESEQHISVGYAPRPQLYLPVEVRVWHRTAAGAPRTVKEMATEFYTLMDLLEETVRAHPRLTNDNKYIKVLPYTLTPPVLEIGDSYQVFRGTMTIWIDLRVF